MMQIKQGCHTHTSKELPWVFVDLQKERRRARKRERKSEKSETKGDWQKFY